MSQTKTASQRWQEFRPSKTLWFWSAAGAAVATMIIGFTVGGWTTGGTAERMAADAASDARAELAATVCVDKFAASADASAQLATLKEKASWEKDDFIKEGGWAKLLGADKTISGAADLCADKLIALEALPQESADVRTVGG